MVIGIDVGNHGAIALLSSCGELIDVQDMPVLSEGPKNRKTLNAPQLWAIIAAMRLKHAYTQDAVKCAWVEDIRYMPTDGGQGAFAFGRSKGMVEMAIAASGLPCNMVSPLRWKRAMGLLNRGKDASRAEAIRRWPRQENLFARVKDDGRAEAALIAEYGRLHG